jgi:hypothetical protein
VLLCYEQRLFEDHHAVFERPNVSMTQHVKPLFIQAKINGVGVNRVLVDGGATVNLLPQPFFREDWTC